MPAVLTTTPARAQITLGAALGLAASVLLDRRRSRNSWHPSSPADSAPQIAQASPVLPGSAAQAGRRMWLCRCADVFAAACCCCCMRCGICTHVAPARPSRAGMHMPARGCRWPWPAAERSSVLQATAQALRAPAAVGALSQPVDAVPAGAASPATSGSLLQPCSVPADARLLACPRCSLEPSVSRPANSSRLRPGACAAQAAARCSSCPAPLAIR